MKFPKLDQFEPVEVFWEDSMSGGSWWTNTEDFKRDDRDLDHVTCGYYLEKTEKSVTICGSRSQYEVDGRTNMRDIITIPLCAITKVRRLKK